MNTIDILREKALRLPLLPGVYIMLDETGRVIYVGKAKLLKNRVSSYFRGAHDLKTQAMTDRVRDFNVIVCGSEFEALVLEDSLIKRHMPQYNILLRDDKSYPYIRLSVKDEYPRFSIVSRPSADDARYYGPFGGRVISREIIETVSKALLLPTCSRKFPRDIGKDRPCLNYHVGSCAGFCRQDAPHEEYREKINQADLILDGKTEQLKCQLAQSMNDAAEKLHFETAAAIRDRLSAISGLENKQRVIGALKSDTDAVGVYRDARKLCYAVLHFIGGSLAAKDYEIIDEPMESDSEAISAILRQYYLVRGVLPNTVFLPYEIDDAQSLERMFSEKSGKRVKLLTPKRGEKLEFIDRANLNAREELLRSITAAQRRIKTLEWLQKTLELPTQPDRIEAFDISNTGSFGVVAAMTVFVRGRPLKKDYRKFRIKGLEHQDDYNSMREVLTRRFRRFLDGDEGFSQLPDLLLIDGGAQHAAVAQSVLSELGISLAVYGMVKDDRHRTRALMTPQGGEIGIVGNPTAFAMIGGIQEETHRFAIEYHRSLRAESIGSALDGIKGVGEKRRNELLKSFKTIKAIRQASLEQLCRVVPKNTAAAVYEHFHVGAQEEDMQ